VSSDPSKLFDPVAQMADMQAMWSAWLGPFRQLLGGLPTRYEALDPAVQELAILATMHNMASLVHNPGKIKSVLNAEIAERAKKLAERA